MPVYKTISLENAVNRQVSPLSTEDKNAAKNIVAQFITYFKAKHLS